MRKRCTFFSVDGVLEQVEDTNAFEIDLPATLERYPELAYITFEVFITSWKYVGTVLRG